jgi:hypothetical protein
MEGGEGATAQGDITFIAGLGKEQYEPSSPGSEEENDEEPGSRGRQFVGSYGIMNNPSFKDYSGSGAFSVMRGGGDQYFQIPFNKDSMDFTNNSGPVQRTQWKVQGEKGGRTSASPRT